MDKPELETLSYKPEKRPDPTRELTEKEKTELYKDFPKRVKSSRAIEDETTPIIEPETKGKNSEVAGQLLPRCETCKDTGRRANKVGDSVSFDNCPDCPEQPTDPEYIKLMTDKPEQPNTELLIVKTIQGLISAANRELGKLDELTNNRKVIIRQVLDDIDILQRGPLFELQKAFE